MLLKFTVDGEEHSLDLTRVMNTEAIAAQKVTGDNWNTVLGRCDEGDAEAITAVVWIAMKRKNPELRYSDVEFPLHETWANRELIDPDADLDPPTPADGTSENT